MKVFGSQQNKNMNKKQLSYQIHKGTWEGVFLLTLCCKKQYIVATLVFLLTLSNVKSLFCIFQVNFRYIWHISGIFGIFVNCVVRSMIYQVSERLTAIWRSVNPHPSTNTTKEKRMEIFFTKNTKETFGHQLTQPR